MKQSGYIVCSYGLLVFIGGLIGHFKAASTASLISGIVFGCLLTATSLMIFKNKMMGIYSALIVTFALDAFFTYRWIHSSKFIPSGMMSLLSLAVIAALVLSLRKQEKKLVD
jgi:uncharacterized membrane protein (UPF0136 family)